MGYQGLPAGIVTNTDTRRQNLPAETINFLLSRRLKEYDSAGMDQEKFQQAKAKAESRYKERLEEIQQLLEENEAEYRADIEALNRAWALLNGDDSRSAAPFSLSYDESGKLLSKTQRIKNTVAIMEEDFISQPVVMARVRKLHPDLTFLDPTVVTKALRELEEGGVLKEIQKARAKSPALFRKVSQNSTPAPQSRPTRVSNAEAQKKARGILAATREILDKLPDPFMTVQLKEMLEETYPESFAGKVKMDSLRVTLKKLVDEGWIQQIAEGAGPRRAQYKHLKWTMEKAV
jgi:ribosomal protein S25